MPDKPLIWFGSARRDLRAFPAVARRLAGFQLRRVQTGLDPDDWKPMPTVGLGVREIRISHRRGTPRVLRGDADGGDLFFHVFEKKTQKTSAMDLELGRERFGALGKLRQHHGKEKRR